MAKDWRCAHCGAMNPATTLTCTGCRRIQGGVVVPGSGTVKPSARRLSVQRPSGRRLPLSAVLVGLVIAVGVVGAILRSSPLSPTAQPTATSRLSSQLPATAGPASPMAGEEVFVTTLEVGDCFSYDQNAESVGYVQRLPCSKPHKYELIHVLVLPEGPYPGENGIDAAVQGPCEAAFEAYTGETYGESRFNFSWFWPDEGAWEADDRSVQCFGYSGYTSMTSMRAGAGEGTTTPT